MPDWQEIVREHLAALGLGAERERGIHAELAEHLKDVYEDALQRGLPPEAAMACAYEQVPDWHRLAQRIRRAGHEEDDMSHIAKTLWLPGMTMLVSSALVLLAMISFVPPLTWVNPRAPVLLLTPWLFSYLLFGAAGAYWSRRAGGTMAARVLSGTFPLALHLAVLFLIAVTMPSNERNLGAGLIWIMVPGAALAVGTLPFLRNSQARS